MTFKHTKFEDSVIMRSLEKVAVEKGLIKPAEMTKLASKTDLTPSGILSQDIMKLCNGLRQSGLHAQAEDIEKKFIKYKIATNIYETSTEKGEDLVHAAHPKGSHKLEGVDGDAVVETILDNHLAAIKMIEKKPTGKLAMNNTSDIIKAAKLVLGQATATRALLSQAYNLMLKSAHMAKQAIESSGDTILSARGRNVFVMNKISRTTNDNKDIVSSPNITMENYSDFIQNLKDFKTAVAPTWLGGIDNKTVTDVIYANIDQALDLASRAKEEFSQSIIGKPSSVESVKPAAVAPAQSVEFANLSNKINNVKSKISSFSMLMNEVPQASRNRLVTWLQAQESNVLAVEKNLEQLKAMPDQEEAKNTATILANKISTIAANIDKVKASWL